MPDKYFDDLDSQSPERDLSNEGPYEPAVPPPASAWRVFSPFTFALALVMFPLPWIDVRGNARHPRTGDKVEVVFQQQSGLQTMYAGYTVLGFFGLDREGNARKFENLDLEACPLMIAYSLLLALGLLLASVVRAAGTRIGLSSLCGLGALAVLGMQLQEGFPFEDVVAKRIADVQAGKPAPGAADDAGIAVERTTWLWLALAFTIAAAASGLLEAMLTPRPRLEMLHEPNPPPYG